VEGHLSPSNRPAGCPSRPLPCPPSHCRSMRVLIAALALSTTALACAPSVAPTVAPTAATMPPSITWTRRSAEHRLLFEQIYAGATRALDSLAQGRSGGWAVILDADETVLDNSEYQRRRAEAGLPYTPESWTAWVAERA